MDGRTDTDIIIFFAEFRTRLKPNSQSVLVLCTAFDEIGPRDQHWKCLVKVKVKFLLFSVIRQQRRANIKK